jgi:NADH-quinone oxidoreductase subunit A
VKRHGVRIISMGIQMTLDFAAVIIFFVVGFLFLFALLTAGAIVRPKAPNPEKSLPYECGIPPVGPPWIQFNIRFYTLALIFLIFDVEIAVLYPCSVLIRDLPGVVLMDVLAFIGILGIGLAYLWIRGDLEWVKTMHSGVVTPGTGEKAPEKTATNAR